MTDYSNFISVDLVQNLNKIRIEIQFKDSYPETINIVTKKIIPSYHDKQVWTGLIKFLMIFLHSLHILKNCKRFIDVI